MTSGELEVERDGPILRALAVQPRTAQRDHLAHVRRPASRSGPIVAEDPGIRVVALRGAGGEAFAAGTDIRQFADFTTGEQGVEYEHRVGRVLASSAADPGTGGRHR